MTTIESCLAVAAPLIAGSRFDRENITSGLDRGFLDATSLMELFIRRGIPQRTAHHAIGELVRTATSRGCRLSDLSLNDFQAFDSTLDDSVYDVLGVENAVRAFQSLGSTAPDRVAKQVERWKTRLAAD